MIINSLFMLKMSKALFALFFAFGKRRKELKWGMWEKTGAGKHGVWAQFKEEKQLTEFSWCSVRGFLASVGARATGFGVWLRDGNRGKQMEDWSWPNCRWLTNAPRSAEGGSSILEACLLLLGRSRSSPALPLPVHDWCARLWLSPLTEPAPPLKATGLPQKNNPVWYHNGAQYIQSQYESVNI